MCGEGGGAQEKAHGAIVRKQGSAAKLRETIVVMEYSPSFTEMLLVSLSVRGLLVC